MDDTGFGVYKHYFTILRTFGVFPFRVDYSGTTVCVYRNGPFKWVYYINYIAIVFGAAFQAVQLALTLQYESRPYFVIPQLCWIFSMGIPLASMLSYLRNEERVAASVNQWCQLEKTIIGSSLRGLASIPNGPLPTMSACHAAQNRLFKKHTVFYLLMAIVAFSGLIAHHQALPRFPAYLYSITAGEDPILMYLSAAYQMWIVLLICLHIYACEVLMVVTSGSLVHCLETLSYRGAVVMAHGQCDVPDLNEVLIKNWAAFEGKGAGAANKAAFVNSHPESEKSKEKAMSALEPRTKDGMKGGGFDEDSVYLASVVQNVVDVQYALDRYKDVEAVVDSLNNSYGKIIFDHESVYMGLMCILFYTPIRHISNLPTDALALYGMIAVFYCIRLFIFFPAMGRVNAMSFTFAESWMEGLRHIPRGKYAYEFYMHKLESCRKLALDAGGFYIMQKGTVLTFVSIVTTNVIVLLQLW